LLIHFRPHLPDSQRARHFGLHPLPPTLTKAVFLHKIAATADCPRHDRPDIFPLSHCRKTGRRRHGRGLQG
jgi:hypothetical protein